MMLLENAACLGDLLFPHFLLFFFKFTQNSSVLEKNRLQKFLSYSHPYVIYHECIAHIQSQMLDAEYSADSCKKY